MLGGKEEGRGGGKVQIEVKRPVMPAPITMMFNGTTAGVVILVKLVGGVDAEISVN